MARAAQIAISRRSVVAGLTLSAAPVGAELAGSQKASAQEKQATPAKSLYNGSVASSLSRPWWITLAMQW